MQLPIGHYLTATWGEKRNTTITPQGIEEKRPIDKWEGLKWIVMTLVSCLFPKAADKLALLRHYRGLFVRGLFSEGSI